MIPLTLLAQLQNYQELFLLPFIVGSKLYHAALDRAKVPHEFLNYPTGGHGYGLRGTGLAAGDAAVVAEKRGSVTPGEP